MAPAVTETPAAVTESPAQGRQPAFGGTVATETEKNSITRDADHPVFGSLDPKVIDQVSALKDTSGALTGIVTDPRSGDGSHAMIIKKARKELIEGDSSRELKGSHHETVGTVYTLEATDEIHLNSKKIFIAAKQILLFSGDNFVHISDGHIVNKAGRIDLNPPNAGHEQGTPANPKHPKDVP